MAVELDRNFRTYSNYTKRRIDIMRRLTPPKRELLLQAIPFLFHVNDRRIPGWINELGDNTGVYGFKLTDEVRNVRKEFFSKQTSVSAGLSRVPMIEAICSIGSAGTLAQTDHSDFDLWIVCRSDVPRGEYSLMGRKAEAIKAWLLQMDPHLDLNFYLATPSDVRAHHFGSVSDDSAGTALGTFLKEEFYRTCVTWAGKLPFWWVLPPDVRSPQEYQRWLDAAHESGHAFVNDLMDMGPLVRSTTEKFLSAVLWQTNKSLKSPFKSLLKLTLVSRYADEPTGKFLAEIVRENTLGSTKSTGTSDPYLCLFQFCAEYWQNRKDEQGTRLMAEMFYLKMLSGDGKKGAADADINDPVEQLRREARNLLREWKLDHTDMQDLSNKDKWGFQKGLNYNDKTQSFVKQIFDRVLERLAELGITFDDGKVVAQREGVDPAVIRLLSEFSNISHKVECFYGTSLKKVPPVPPSFRDFLSQSSYTINYQSDKSRWSQWSITEDVPESLAKREAAAWGKVLGERSDKKEPVVSADGDPGDPGTEVIVSATDTDAATLSTEALPLAGTSAAIIAVPGDAPTAAISPASTSRRRSKTGELLMEGGSMLFMVGWLCANRLVTASSGLNIVLDGQRRPVSELRRLIQKFGHFLRHPLYQDALPESTFKTPPKPFKIAASFDLMLHSQFSGLTRPGMAAPDAGKSTVRTAVGFNATAVEQVTVVTQDTYGVVRVHEVPAKRYGPAALMARMLRDMEGVPLDELDNRLMIHFADTPFHKDFASDFEGALRRAHQELAALPPRKNFGVRYITKLGGRYVALTRIGEEPLRGVEFADMAALLTTLEAGVGVPIQTIIDPVVEGPERMRAMYSHWNPGRIQVFVHRTSQASSIHVIDETGCFYNERLGPQDLDPQLAGLMFYLAQMGGMPLKFALKKDGRLQFKVWELAESISGDGGYLYNVNPYLPPNPTAAAAQLSGLVYLRFFGTLNFRDAHRVEIVARGETKSVVLPGGQIAEHLAGILLRVIPASSCRDFAIIGLERDAGMASPGHVGEYLGLRRAIDRQIRRAIAESRG